MEHHIFYIQLNGIPVDSQVLKPCKQESVYQGFISGRPRLSNTASE
jgi:hypothetical protein